VSALATFQLSCCWRPCSICQGLLHYDVTVFEFRWRYFGWFHWFHQRDVPVLFRDFRGPTL